uniref:Piwi domain-containing protein n=1 Tax=Panagrellus redivivus TaxID=6233 RepID=A0A7E4UTV3_PANRE
MLASLRQMFLPPAIPPDSIAIVFYPSLEVYATREKCMEIGPSDGNETGYQKMYKTVPDAKVVYIFSTLYGSKYMDRNISGLKEVGYAIIKVVNSMSWFYTEMLYRLKIDVPIGECIAFVMQHPNNLLPESYEIFEKTAEGYKRIGNHNSCDGLYFRYCPTLKNIFILTNWNVEGKISIEIKYNHQEVYFADTNPNWLKCIWDEYDGKVQNFIPSLLELKIEFKYGNNFRVETVDYSQLPFEKTFELDIEDACKLEVNYFLNSAFRQLLKPDYLFPIGKNRVLKIVLKVGLEFYPDLDVTVASEKNTVEGAVYAIDYNHKSKLFTGTLITAVQTGIVVIENSDDISEVFKQLDAKKGATKLRGVFVDYPGHIKFPLETHRAIVNALPSPKTKVCIGRVHTEWAMHLKNSGAKLQAGEYLVIADAEREYPECLDYQRIHTGPKDVCFLKTKEGFKIVEEFEHFLPASKFTTVVYIVEKKTHNFEAPFFSTKKTLFSKKSKLPKNIGHLFAWEYFNGKNFDEYMVEPYRGVSFVATIGNNHYDIHRCHDSHYGSSECYITCAVDKLSDPDLKFTVDIEFVGYSEKCTVLEIPTPKSDYVLLHIYVDEHLIPTVTVTESNMPLLPEGLATSDKSVLKEIKSVLENQDFVSYSNLSPMNASNVEKAELTDNQEDNELKKVSKGLSETTDSPDISVVEAILAESTADIEAVATSEETILHCISPIPDVSNVTPHTVLLTFTHCNRVLIDAGPDYTGDDEFPAYLRLRHKNERYEFVVGQKAKAALITHRESVIYDVSGLLAANLNPKRENAAWNFKTSRGDDGGLLVHLNTKDKASPVVVFGHIVRAVLQHVNEHLPTKLERVRICLPSEAVISEKDLFVISYCLPLNRSCLLHTKKSSCTKRLRFRNTTRRVDLCLRVAYSFH